MPAYQRWGYAHHTLPPTPPEYQTSYMTPMSAMSDDGQNGYYSSQGYARHGYPREYADGYSVQHSKNHFKRLGSSDFHMNYPLPMPSHYGYAQMPTAVLPNLHPSQDPGRFPPTYAPVAVESKPKEEKPTGGVAQHLDYEMDLMASFVAEMSQQIVSRGGSPPTVQFRKYVSQILSSTRLPSSTIMLGLFYLQERIKIESKRGQEKVSSGTVYRMLTTCLLLGSKFLDDNTFQNRSWAEVSSIPVHELNVMELDWLKDFNWEIHGMMYDNEEGFFMWIEHWHAYEDKAQRAKAKDMQKLAPINTSIGRHPSLQRPVMSPEGPIPPQYQQGAQYDTQWVRPLISEYSPPSAPHSGPTTPDFYGHNWHYSRPSEAQNRSSWAPNPVSGFNSQRSHFGTNRPSHYRQSYHPGQAWSGHGANCGCGMCLKNSEYHLGPANYGVQTVVG